MKTTKRMMTLLLVLVLAFTGCGLEQQENNRVTEDIQAQKTAAETEVSDDFKIHFIDVGQGDATLIQAGTHSMLIDAGENNQGDIVSEYIAQQGIQALDYVIGTHPHSDHIGGLDTVIQNFSVDTVILPDKIHTSRTFEDVLTAIDEKGLSITLARPGDNYQLGEAAFTILAPVRDYGDNLNNWSVGIKVNFGGISMIATGDAEQEAEQDMVENGIDLSADLIKLGHHGSSTSSTEAFLAAVQPQYAIISTGSGNMYGHPHREVLEQLASRNVEIYRTDEGGTVVAASDGKTISWSTGPSNAAGGGESSQEQEEQEEVYTEDIFILNTNTKKIHRQECESVKQIKPQNYSTGTEKEKLQQEGFEACKRCNP